MTDRRDPQALGALLITNAETVRKAYGKDIKLSDVYDVHVQYLDMPDYEDNGLMSNDPAQHHSKTDQSVGTRSVAPSAPGFSG